MAHYINFRTLNSLVPLIARCHARCSRVASCADVLWVRHALGVCDEPKERLHRRLVQWSKEAKIAVVSRKENVNKQNHLNILTHGRNHAKRKHSTSDL